MQSRSSDITYGETSILTITHIARWFLSVDKNINNISLHIYIESSQLSILSFTLNTLFFQSFRRLQSWIQSVINFDRNVKIISFEVYNDTQVNSLSWKTLFTVSFFPEALQSGDEKIILSSSETEFLLCNKSVFVASSYKLIITPWRKVIDRASLTYSQKKLHRKWCKNSWSW